MSSRGMGDINPSKMPGKKTIHRKDKPQDVAMYAEGGKVNAAGNYTKPELRKRIVAQVKAAATQGTPVWVSHNLGMEGTIYGYFVANVTGTYLDAPNTTSIVYYTAYWNQRIGDNPSASGYMWLNRAYRQFDDAWRPAPSSSWTATEIWDSGTPYTPPTTDTTIQISAGNVGIGTSPNINYKLNVGGNINTTGNLTTTGNVGIGTTNPGYKLDVNGNLYTGGDYTAGASIYLNGWLSKLGSSAAAWQNQSNIGTYWFIDLTSPLLYGGGNATLNIHNLVVWDSSTGSTFFAVLGFSSSYPPEAFKLSQYARNKGIQIDVGFAYNAYGNPLLYITGSSSNNQMYYRLT
jgi:hypothetical protein